MGQLTMVVIDLLTLKVLIFSLVRHTLERPDCTRSHNFYPNIPGGTCPRTPLAHFPGGACPRTPLARVGLYIVTANLCTCYVILFFLDNKLIFMRKFKNADQIYTYLVKLKFNKCIGPNSNCRQL